MAVKWMFLGCYESPFLHCSKVLQKVKQQAWSMGEHHVIVRVQLKDALDRDDVMDMSTHEAQVTFFDRLIRSYEMLHPLKGFNVTNFEDILGACYNNLLLDFDLKSTWEEALTNGINKKLVLLKWRGFVHAAPCNATLELYMYNVFMMLHKEGVFQDARCLNTEVAVTEQEYHEHLLVSQSGVRVPHYWANWWLRILSLKDHGG